MRKAILSVLSLFAVFFMFVNLNANNKITVNIIASFTDNTNVSLLENSNVDYGSNIVVTANNTEDETFAYWIVDGIVDINRSASTSFVATNNLEAVAIYYRSDNFAVSFVDHSGSLIETKYVSSGADVEEPIKLPTKYGYEYNNPKWELVYGTSSDFTNIDENKVFKLRYKRLDDLNKVLVNGIEYDYNEVVTLTSENPEFVYWEENGKIISFNKSYSFSALYDRTIIEVSEVSMLPIPIITVSHNLNIRLGYISKVAQVYLPDGYTLLEQGFLVSDNEFTILTLDNATIVKAKSIHPITNEYLTSINNDYNNIRAYAIYKDNSSSINTVYSDLVVTSEREEDFEGETFLTSSYSDGSFTRTDGVIFNYGHSRNQENYPIENSGLMLRRASDSYLEITFPKGLNSFAFDYRKAFTNKDPRQLEIYINGVVIHTTPVFGNSSGEDDIVRSVNFINLGYHGVTVVKIKNVGSTTTNRQTVLDNILWTEFGADVEEVLFHEVTFDSNGGSFVLPQTIKDGKKLTEPVDPFKQSHTFLGWYDNANLDGEPFDFNTQIANDLTLYAKWDLISGSFEITYVLNNGQEDIVVNAFALEKLTEPAGITNEDLLLSGWFVDEYYEEKKWDFDSDIVEGDLILYARWSKVFVDQTGQEGESGSLNDDELANNAAKLSLEPSYFMVKVYKGTSNVPYIDDGTIRLYYGSAIDFSIHESFVISEVKIEFGKYGNNEIGQTQVTLGSINYYLTNHINQTITYNNLEISYFKITNLSSVSAERVYINSIEITYYQIGPDVIKEDDINRPVFDMGEYQLVDLIVGEAFNPSTVAITASDLEDGLVDVFYVNTTLNINKKGIYYAFYYAVDTDNNRTDAYITIIVREENQIENYYQSVNLNNVGDDLLLDLRDLLEDSISYVSYQTGNQSMEISDRDPYNYNNVWLIYSSESISGKWNATNWTKEHVWAKSVFGLDYLGRDRSITGGYEVYNNKKFDNSYKGIASDLHNLRAINQTVNGDHSNYPFANYVNTDGYPYGGFYVGGQKYFYPGEKHIGDVARILLYMHVLYGLTPREDIALLVAWHLADPVDNFERIRNEVIFGYQGNRNPFIDYEQLVEAIWN